MNDITGTDHVRTQYATEDRLETRTSLWQPTEDGRDPSREAFKAIDRAMTGNSGVLEVGCGTGDVVRGLQLSPS